MCSEHMHARAVEGDRPCADRSRPAEPNSSKPDPPVAKAPTPPPNNHNDDHVLNQTPDSRARSPSQTVPDDATATATMATTKITAATALPLRRGEDGSRRSPSIQASHLSASRRPIIDQPDVRPSTRPSTPISASPPSDTDSPSPATGDKPTKSLASTLLPDLSQYTNPDPVPDSDTTTLEELAHLVRLSKYQERKRANTRIRLQRSLISAALSARLTRCGEIAHRNLVDCFRTEDKKTFASLYNAIHDVRKSCDELRRFTLLEPEMGSLNASAFQSSEDLAGVNTTVADPGSPRSLSPFLNDISASAREVFLNFLIQIRTNPDFLAARLCSMSTAELTALTSFHQGLEPIESVLPGQTARTSASRANTGAGGRNGPNPVGRLLSFQRHDPLSALIYTCFANSAGPDSSEDRRRTQIWGSACSKLISESKPGLEPLLVAVFNAWASMRDWSGKSNMEWYLMKILEDGAFLLDRAEDQQGTRFHISGWAREGNAAAEDFYQRAVTDLFAAIDDEENTGIPEGFLELGNEIIRRLEPRLADSTRTFLICKWLFQNFFLGAIIHPETHGMMVEYHVTEYGRQKILRQVAMRAMQYVAEYAYWTKKTPLSFSSKIQTHIENIFSRLRGAKSARPTAKLLPARSVTSLRETVEVHPYLIISPADILTLVNALYPEQRPQSRASGSFRSGAPSISGMSAVSQPTSIVSSRNFDTASVLSNSASSMISDAASIHETVSHEPRIGTPLRYSPPVGDPHVPNRNSTYEDEGYRLRLALHEMSQALGLDVVSGAGHPCAERWAVLFISSDGRGLSTHMTFDPDDDGDEDENSSTTDTDEDEESDGLELDKEYSQLRDSILKLVEEYEIPRTMLPEGSRAQLSNRATGIKKYRYKNKIITPEKAPRSRNPYHQRMGADEAQDQSNDKSKTVEDEKESSVLVTMLKAASSQSKAQSDFVSAHLYWRTLQHLNSLTTPSLCHDDFGVLLNIFSRGPRDSIRRSAAAIEDYDAWLVWLKQSQERLEGHLDGMLKRLRALRDKMWYVTDVHTSAPYEHSRNICVALKTMGLSRRLRMRVNTARGSSATYIYRTESQIMELLAATEEQGGPNKLSDDQAEKTTRWLQQYGIESWFCKGEERIHRFCLEVDNCISKLIGENIMDAPVLWSSELYLRDRRILENNKNANGVRDRESLWGGDDASSVISDQVSERRFGGARPLANLRDLRNMQAFNSSQPSFDSPRYSFSRASAGMSDVLDNQDYFGVSSPIHTIDSSTTFWSPFQAATASNSAASRAHSPTSSVTNLSSTFSHQYHNPLPTITSQSSGRPGTSTSSNETVYQQRLSEEKSRFLVELRQTLTSLLLSDLGNLVFVRGSETDAWFDDLGQQCIDMQDSAERKAKRAAAASSMGSPSASAPGPSSSPSSATSKKPRTLEKKKSFGNLRGAGETPSENGTTEGPENPTPVHDSTTNDAKPTRNKTSNRGGTAEFPYKKAYQRLLRMFAVHPNPHAKLRALEELKHLIISSLTLGGSRRSRLALARSEPQDPSTGDAPAGKPNPLDDAIDNMKERRSQSGTQPGYSTSNQFRSGDAKSLGTTGLTSMDTAVMEVLVSLFRDPSIRPKTLFRDLQFIASFVPPSVLDKSDRGVSFWDAGLAAIQVKQEVCQTMIKVTDNLVEHYTNKRRQEAPLPPSPGTEQPPPSGSPPPITSRYSLTDAVRMVITTAREGYATSQRELGLFYLSHPELIDRVTMPLSKPREVFKQAIMEKYGGAGKGGAGARLGDRERRMGVADEEGEDVRSDPGLMCVALHWMQAADSGGDKIATDFIRQQGLV